MVVVMIAVVGLCGCPPTQPNPDENGTLVRYTAPDGTAMAVTAVPGRVVIQMDPSTPETTVLSLIQERSGSILSSAPEFGLYGVVVASGKEGEFISAIRGQPDVISALPAVSLDVPAPNKSRTAGFDAAFMPLPDLKAACPQVPMGVIDFFSPPNAQNCAHGLETSSIAEDGNPDPVSHHDLSAPAPAQNFGAWPGSAAGGTSDTYATSLHLANRLRNNPRECPLVMSMSVGPVASSNAARLQADQGAFWSQTAATLKANGGENSVLVVSMGNGLNGAGMQGVDLKGVIDRLRKEFPDLFRDGRIIFAGSCGKPGDCEMDMGLNYSSGPGDPVVYAPGRDVPIPSNSPPCPPTATGTSFSAPRVANAVAEHIRRERARNPNKPLRDILNEFIEGHRFFDPACAERFAGAVRVTKHTMTYRMAGQDELRTDVTGDFAFYFNLAVTPASAASPVRFFLLDAANSYFASYSPSGTRKLSTPGTDFEAIQPVVADPDHPINFEPLVYGVDLSWDRRTRTGVLNIAASGYAAYYFEGNPIPYVPFVDDLVATFDVSTNANGRLIIDPQGASHPSDPYVTSETITLDGELNRKK